MPEAMVRIRRRLSLPARSIAVPPGSQAAGKSRGAGTSQAAGKSRSAGKSQAAGFTLLETIVALAIFAAGAMALYGLFNTNLTALGRVQATAEQLPVARNAIEVLASVNPWHQPEGEFEIDGRQVFWSARLVQPIRHGQTNAGAMAGFDFGLYEIEFTIADRGRRLGTWRLRSVGYERVRGLPPGDDIF